MKLHPSPGAELPRNGKVSAHVMLVDCMGHWYGLCRIDLERVANVTEWVNLLPGGAIVKAVKVDQLGGVSIWWKPADSIFINTSWDVERSDI